MFLSTEFPEIFHFKETLPVANVPKNLQNRYTYTWPLENEQKRNTRNIFMLLLTKRDLSVVETKRRSTTAKPCFLRATVFVQTSVSKESYGHGIFLGYDVFLNIR
jgi:hypothetical protein